MNARDERTIATFIIGLGVSLFPLGIGCGMYNFNGIMDGVITLAQNGDREGIVAGRLTPEHTYHTELIHTEFSAERKHLTYKLDDSIHVPWCVEVRAGEDGNLRASSVPCPYLVPANG